MCLFVHLSILISIIFMLSCLFYNMESKVVAPSWSFLVKLLRYPRSLLCWPFHLSANFRSMLLVSGRFQKIIDKQIHWNYQNWLKSELQKHFFIAQQLKSASLVHWLTSIFSSQSGLTITGYWHQKLCQSKGILILWRLSSENSCWILLIGVKLIKLIYTLYKIDLTD